MLCIKGIINFYKNNLKPKNLTYDMYRSVSYYCVGINNVNNV